MTDKKYTHKIVMFDVNSAKRVAYFENEKNAKVFEDLAPEDNVKFASDDSGVNFNMNNIVQINPVEVIEG